MKEAKYLADHLYTADPSAHVFNGKLYIYPSHDIESGIPENDNGDHFNMQDYHVFSMYDVDGEVTDHGVVLDVKDIPWAGRQLWAPDAAYKNNKYYLYFPLKDQNDIFRIGVAVSVSTSTFVFICLIFSLCPTPKRCSSSMIKSPKSLNSTSFDKIRCVPTTIST